MSPPRILVMGATGRTGGAIVAELLGAGFPVRALVRKDDARAAALRKQGVEVRTGDMTDADRVGEAFRGIHRAYWLPPYDAAMLTGATVFASAARNARVESIVTLTQWLSSPTHPAFLTRQHWLADQVFASLSGIALTVVNPGFFADSPYLATIRMSAHLGILPWPYGDSVSAPPSVRDIARVAAAALMDPNRHGGQTYRPTGPKLLSASDMAEILSRVLGRSVRPVPTPAWLFLKAAYLDGSPMALLACMEHYIEEHRRGAFAAGAPNDDVNRVTGHPPESFETVARRLGASPANQRSPSRSLRELARFLALPAARAPAIRRYLRGLQQVAPMRPLYAGESEIWHCEHGIPCIDPEPVVASRHSLPADLPLHNNVAKGISHD